MSKLDAQRAMREANWAARQKAAPAKAPAPAKTPAPNSAAAAKAPAPTEAPAPRKAAAEEASLTATSPEPEVADLCGHRAISGKTCTSARGHSEKNHRYK
jgi:hypothetical protein